MSKELFRRELAKFQPYVPGKPIEEVKREYGLDRIEKLASNENQLGPSPMAVEAIIKAVHEINFYPEATAYELKRELAADLGVKEENLVIGNGGEELLQVIAQTFINAGDEIIVASPSFGIYNTTVGLLGGVIHSVPFQNNQYDFDGMLEKVNDNTKLIYVCSPNNPTGNIVTKKELEALLGKLPEDVTVIMDEAYYEFAASNPEYPDSIQILRSRPNMVILRTFSKVSGIAGVRIGYVITSEKIAAEMNKIKLTFDVNRLAQEAARGALKDKEYTGKTVALTHKSIDMMEAYFDSKGLDYIKSYANFVFVDVRMHSKTAFEELMKKGVIIRPGYFWGWDNWIRVSTGTLEQTQFFLDKLEEVMK
ncbi:MAG TPA: histidinol-phosphate transaminase [Anaerovoracaceae bacterium]|nr:histidinol-phosphate transaminase [Anaerovoracaceae bacterium]